MQTEQGNMLLSLRAVQAFLEENAARLASIATTGARKRLDDIVVALSAHASDQTGGALAAKGSTRKQQELRKALYDDHMAPIARIAKADLPRTAELEPLRMPRRRLSTERLVAAAEGMAKAAAPHADVFIASALPADFIEQLNAAAAAVVLSLKDRKQIRGRAEGATRDLAAKLSAGRKIVHVLDALVKRSAKNDPGLLVNWRSVQRVQKVPGGRATPATPTAPSGAPSSTTPTTGTSSPASPAPATGVATPATPAAGAGVPTTHVAA